MVYFIQVLIYNNSNEYASDKNPQVNDINSKIKNGKRTNKIFFLNDIFRLFEL